MTEPEEAALDEAAPVAEAVPPPELAAAVPEATLAGEASPAQPSPGFSIPDFAEDKRTIESFDAARERFQRSESQSAEDEIRKGFKRRRELLQAEVATAEAVIAERQTKWEKTLEAYGKRYPKLVEKTKARLPSFLQNLMSFGKAGRMYSAVQAANADLNDARSLRRRKENEDEEIDNQQRRALAKLEATLKDHSKQKDNNEKFLQRPGNAALAQRVADIRAERTAYAQRLEAGNVPPLEQRDRYFAQVEAVLLEAPCTGIAIVGVEAYGELHYLIFRDRERHFFYRPYDARLEGLSDSVFDVYRIADRFEAKMHRREGKPMNLADHLTEFLRDDERAKSEARRIRALLREPRPARPPEGDHSLMDLLSELAKTAGRFSV